MTKFVGTCTWDDVPHISPEVKQELWNSIPPYQRDARSKGIPQLGSGAIYPVPESEILCDPFEFPAWFRHAYALDVGWNRTAALWGALDPETDVLYLYAEYYRGQAEPAVHAAAIRARGDWIPGVIDPAARGRGQRDGEQLLSNYVNLGLTTLTVANNAVEAGIYEVWGRLSTGRLRVFKHLQSFLGEYRLYRRDEKGAVVKKDDHLMDAMRYLCLSGVQRGIQRPFEQWPGRPGTPVTAGQRGFEADYDPYAQARGTAQSTPSRQAYQGIGGWPGGVR